MRNLFLFAAIAISVVFFVGCGESVKAYTDYMINRTSDESAIIVNNIHDVNDYNSIVLKQNFKLNINQNNVGLLRNVELLATPIFSVPERFKTLDLPKPLDWRDHFPTRGNGIGPSIDGIYYYEKSGHNNMPHEK